MKKEEQLKEWIKQLQESEGQSFEIQEEKIIETYKEGMEKQSFAIRLLSILGGGIASFLLLAFIMSFSLKHSDIGMLITGGLSIVFAIYMSKIPYRKTQETISVSVFLIGLFLIYLGVEGVFIKENSIYLLFILIAFACLFLTQQYLLSFISVLVIHLGVLLLILTNNTEDFLNLYVCLLAFGYSYLLLNEAKIIKRRIAFSKLFHPIKTASLIFLIIGLGFLANQSRLPLHSTYVLLSSAVLVLLILFLLPTIFKLWGVEKKKDKVLSYVLCVLVLVPTALSPAITGAILILLLSYHVNYKTGFVLGILAGVYFIGQFYYDLSLSLWTKSLLLFSSGVFFLLLFLFTNKRLYADEKV